MIFQGIYDEVCVCVCVCVLMVYFWFFWFQLFVGKSWRYNLQAPWRWLQETWSPSHASPDSVSFIHAEGQLGLAAAEARTGSQSAPLLHSHPVAGVPARFSGGSGTSFTPTAADGQSAPVCSSSMILPQSFSPDTNLPPAHGEASLPHLLSPHKPWDLLSPSCLRGHTCLIHSLEHSQGPR